MFHQSGGSQAHLESLEDFASSFIAARGDEGLQDVAPGRVARQSQQVGRAQRTQAAEEHRSLLEAGQRLDQARAVVADGRQRDLPTAEIPGGVRLSRPQRAVMVVGGWGLWLVFLVLYLGLCAALCCLRLVIHLIGEQGHEEGEAAGVAGARLSAVEGLEASQPHAFR